MKRVITTSIFLIAFLSYSSAQGNLQFNQVINGTTAPVTFNYNSITLGTIVVPAGKVLKIENTSYTYIATNGVDIYTHNYYVFIDRFIGWGGSNDLRTTLPLWLSEGTYVIKSDGGEEIDAIFSYSAIEFNVVP